MAELVRRKIEVAATAGTLLPTTLALNTVVLFAWDSLYGIPGWIKTAATLFLQF